MFGIFLKFYRPFCRLAGFIVFQKNRFFKKQLPGSHKFPLTVTWLSVLPVPLVQNIDKKKIDIEKAILQQNLGSRFLAFASIECNGVPYMTPSDFLDSMLEVVPKLKRNRVPVHNVDELLRKTPPKGKGSSHMFRDLDRSGMISYSEYVLLYTALTSPKSSIKVAFRMFDSDANAVLDESEFLLITKIISNTVHDDIAEQDGHKTTLGTHFFGNRKTLNFDEFRKFIENLHDELVEMEFLHFSQGRNYIHGDQFAEVLLKFAQLDRSKKKRALHRAKSIAEKEVSFQTFKWFFDLIENVENLEATLRLYTIMQKPVSRSEFQKALRIATGENCEDQVALDIIFCLFDFNEDGYLAYDELVFIVFPALKRAIKVSSTDPFQRYMKCVRRTARLQAC